MPSDAADIRSGLSHLRAKRLPAAEAAFRSILAADPANLDALRLLAMLCHDAGRYAEAEGILRRAIERYPDRHEFHNNLGIALVRLSREAEAVESFVQAVRLKPDYVEAIANWSNALLHTGKVAQAVEAGRKALAVRPDYAAGYSVLSAALRRQGRLAESIEVSKKGTALGLDYPEAHNDLAATLEQQGRLAEAIASYRRAVELAPADPAIHSNLIFTLNYDPSVKPAELFAEHREWAKRHADPLAGEITAHANDRSPDRRLRIGYVSADFREHTRALFMEAVIAAHDKKAFEIVCYSSVKQPDETTQRIRAVVDIWCDAAKMSDAELAKRIRADRIDILVELTGHMGYNRLPVFARKPAPVQVAYPGYPNTTGLKQIDYLITDADRDPVGGPDFVAQASRLCPEANDDGKRSQAGRLCYENGGTGRAGGTPGRHTGADRFYTEQLIRLPVTSQCYRPSADAPPVSPSPAVLRGHVTFCCFNKLVKVTPGIMGAWAEILKAVPASRLMVMAASAGREDADIRKAFAARGVPGDRLDIVPPVRRVDYLWRYNQVDMALDTFPYNGHTTTLDGLWMGVPAVTLCGATHVAREGAAALWLMGLPELVAKTPKEYVDAAVKLAANPARLQALRHGLRKQMAESPLTNAARLTREIEKAYRGMWTAWCEKR